MCLRVMRWMEVDRHLQRRIVEVGAGDKVEVETLGGLDQRLWKNEVGCDVVREVSIWFMELLLSRSEVQEECRRVLKDSRKTSYFSASIHDYQAPSALSLVRSKKSGFEGGKIPQRSLQSKLDSIHPHGETKRPSSSSSLKR
jgi:hypothetical protein